MDCSHIFACRRAWHRHYESCPQCRSLVNVVAGDLCETGRILYDEWCHAISADPAAEHVIGTEADDGRLALGTKEREDQERYFGEGQEPEQEDDNG